MSKRRVLVTGSEGFIGRYVTKRLKADGHEVVGFDTQIDPFGHDISHSLNVAKKLGHTRDVIHLSGVLGTHELFGKIREAVDTNIHGMVNLLEGLRIMPGHDRSLTVIDQPHIWVNPYETTKGAAIRLAQSYSQEFGIPLHVVRVYNAYGPGQAYGPGHPQKIVPTFAVKAWKGLPLPIWGDGKQLVDLVYAGDVATALVDGQQNASIGGTTFYAGTGLGCSVNELAEVVLQYVEDCGGPVGGVYHQPMRRGEQKVDPRQHLSPVEAYPFRLDRLLETIDSYRNVALRDDVS